jgi:hypothetical protein
MVRIHHVGTARRSGRRRVARATVDRWVRGDEDYRSCGLGYVFNGISADDRYMVVIRADISSPDRKCLLPPRQTHKTADGSWESSDPKVEAEMRVRLEKSIADSPPASFTPSLNQLDAVVRSLKILH